MLLEMIRRPIPSSHRHAWPPGIDPVVVAAPVPAWLRRAVDGAQSLEDAAVAAGAAIGALDAVVRRQERWAGVWRHRLALTAAAATASQAGRAEDEAALRDAVLLTRPGDAVGPAGLLLLAWRRLAARPAAELLRERSLAAALKAFGYGPDDETVSELADALRQLAASESPVGALLGGLAIAQRHGFGPMVGAWLADVLLARRLGWIHAVPLLGTEMFLAKSAARSRRSTLGAQVTVVEADLDRTKNLLAAQARAALGAIDLSAELGRRAEKLLAVAPKLRAKGAKTVVDHLLSEDALVASRGDKTTGMSDRGLRRLFDRLVELGAVRELSGRPTFRIYGL